MERQVTSHLKQILAWLEKDNYEFSDEQLQLLSNIALDTLPEDKEGG